MSTKRKAATKTTRTVRAKSGDNITGGTGDFNPQIYTINLQQDAANTPTWASFPVPINRLAQSTNRAVIMEILRVTFIIADLSPSNAQAEMSCILATRQPGYQSAIDCIADSASFAYVDIDLLAYGTPANAEIKSRVFPFDLTDGAGHGYLVATDKIYMGILSLAWTSTSRWVAKIEYRMKEVGLAEYVGMVQSQQ